MATITLPSAAPAPTTTRSPSRAVGVALSTIAMLTFPLILTALLTPKFAEIFKDFGVEIPVVGRWLINIGQSLKSPLGIAAIATWVLVVAAVTAISSYYSRAAAGLLLLGAFLFAGAWVVALVVSMFTPLVTMIESLQQGGSR